MAKIDILLMITKYILMFIVNLIIINNINHHT